MANIFLVSDTHFGHANFLTFLKEDGHRARPFGSVEEMDELMVTNWNRVVRPQDKVYHVGDVAMGLRAFLAIMPRLHGHKRLIRGNHDDLKVTEYLPFFDEVYGSRQLDKWVLTHYPMHPDSLAPRWCKGNIHGHIHEKVVMREVESDMNYWGQTRMISEPDPRYINVCVEQIDYTPIALETLNHRAG